MTKYELEHLLTIGEFHLNTGILEICDPAINDFLCTDVCISALNQSTVVIRNCPPGIYKVFYEIDPHGVPVSIICYPSITSYADIIEHDRFFNYAGAVIPQFSRTICVVDSAARDDASLCVRELEPDALYDAQALLDMINTSPYPRNVCSTLENYLQFCVKNCKAAAGQRLIDITESTQLYWCGYRSPDVPSSHWACEIVSRINGPLPVSCFQGGIVARTGRTQTCKVYIYRGRTGMISAVRIFLVHDRDDFEIDGTIKKIFANT